MYVRDPRRVVVTGPLAGHAPQPASELAQLMAHVSRWLAGLVLHLVATRQGHATTGDQGTSPWLLPGGRPGQPVSPCRLSERLRQIGIRPGPARSTALFQLATELPAAILARMPGIHIAVAVAWQPASAGDWMTYAADVSHRSHARERALARDQHADPLPSA
jgi:hypothetical protein